MSSPALANTLAQRKFGVDSKKKATLSDLQGRFLAFQLYTLINISRLNGRTVKLGSGKATRSNFSFNDNSRTSPQSTPPTKSSCRTRKQLQLHFDHDNLIVAFVVCHPLQSNFRLFLSDSNQRLVPLSR